MTHVWSVEEASDLSETDSEGEVLEAALFGISGVLPRVHARLRVARLVPCRCNVDANGNVASIVSLSVSVSGGRARS